MLSAPVAQHSVSPRVRGCRDSSSSASDQTARCESFISVTVLPPRKGRDVSQQIGITVLPLIDSWRDVNQQNAGHILNDQIFK